MLSNLMRAAVLRRAGLISACVAMVVVTQFSGAGKAPLRNLGLDPAADKLELFAGVESGAFSTRMVPDDITGGNVFIENKTAKPLTVILPPAFVGIHVLKQLNGFNGNGFGLNGGGLNGGSGNGGLTGGMQGGGGQAQGGGFGAGQQGLNGGLNGGFNGQNGQNGIGNNGVQGFFSIPPHQVAQVPYQAVCLNYGKPDPMPRMTYLMVPVEKYTDDKVVQETLKIYGTGQMDYSVAQAAVWHLTDKLSVEELANLTKLRSPGDENSKEAVFTMAQLKAADELLASAKKKAAEREKTEVKKAVPVSKSTATSQAKTSK
ncbi:MAG: hypothetical protein JWM11_2674 [Planctomycetaceae bacterium]|nr:hypothetical protein [Planctomycetaceae bacterium]